MITGHRQQFIHKAMNRGYSWDEVRACVVHEDGDTITVDETHAAYPRHTKPGFVPPAPTQLAYGPGTELKRLLRRIGIKASPSCACNAKARVMDQNEEREPGWCAANIDTIVGWLREEAAKRGLPFIDAIGRLLVRKAVRNSSRRAAS